MGRGFAVPKKPAGWHRVRAAGFNFGMEEYANVIVHRMDGVSAGSTWSKWR